MEKEEMYWFEPYERKIRKQQNELRKLKKELEYMRKVLHRKNLDGMRQCRRRKELKEEIENLKAQLKEEEDIATVAYIQGANHGSVMYRNARDEWKKKAEELDKKFSHAKDIVRTAIDALYSGGTDTEMMDRCEEILKQFLKEE